MSIQHVLGMTLLWGLAVAAHAAAPAAKEKAAAAKPSAVKPGATTAKSAAKSDAAAVKPAAKSPARAQAGSAAQAKPGAASPTPPKPAVPYVPPPPPRIIRSSNSLTIEILVPSPNVPTAPRLDCVVRAGPVVPVRAVAFSPDGKTLAAAGHKEVLLWDVVEAKLLKRLGTGEIGGAVHALVFSPDGKWLAAGEGRPSGSGAVRMFELESGGLLRSLEGPKDTVYALAVSPDGKFLAAGSADKLVYVWNAADGELATTIKDHNDWVLAVAFSPDGKLLASAGADKAAMIWEVGSWKSAAKMLERDAVQGAAFTPDSQLLALAVGGPVEQSIRTRRAVEPPPDPAALKRKEPIRPQITLVVRAANVGPGAPLDLVFSPRPNGKMCVPCSDKTVRVFNSNGGQIATLTGHSDWVYCVDIAADGTKIASGGADGVVRLYNGTDHRPLATLVQPLPGKGDWLIVTPLGYFAASSPNIVRWSTANVKTEPEKLSDLLHKPEMIRDHLAGKRVPSPAVR